MDRDVLRCPNCGAPAPGDECEYCGTVFKPKEKSECIDLKPMTKAEFDSVNRLLRGRWISEIMLPEDRITHSALMEFSDMIRRDSDQIVLESMDVEQQVDCRDYSQIPKQAYDRKLLNAASTQLIVNGSKHVMKGAENEKSKNTDDNKSIITRIFSRSGGSNE